MTQEQTFQEGDTVYSLTTAKEFVIGRVSKGGQIAFGDGPFTVGDYEPTYRYTHDKAQAVESAIKRMRADLRHYEKQMTEAQKNIQALQAEIARLEA